MRHRPRDRLAVRNPWGEDPGQKPDVVEQIFRRKSSGGGSGPSLPDFPHLPWKYLLPVIPLLWALSGLYRVEADEAGVVLRFGRYTRSEISGLHWHIPYPIERVLTPQVSRINRTEVGGDTSGTEHLMLTGDENIVAVKFTVLWRIKDARKFLFSVETPHETVAGVAESVMRGVVGHNKIDAALTGARQEIEQQVQAGVQQILDNYQSGVEVVQVAVQEIDPPEQVIEAFRDVQAARSDQERLRNEAETYANKVIPEARGEAGKLRQDAEAYKQQTVAEAQGQAQRFLKVYHEYAKAKDVTAQRLYWETAEKVFSQGQKTLLTPSGALPLLPMLSGRRDGGDRR